MSVEIEKKARIAEENYLDLCSQIQEKYGTPGFITKVDVYYKNVFATEPEKYTVRLRKLSNDVWRSNDNGKYEVCSKVRKTLDDGTEVNEELETELSVKDTEAFKAALSNAGLEYFYTKTKNGLEWTIPLKYKNHNFTLHAEVFKVTSDNGYKDYFLEIEYTGNCDIELDTDFVTEKINTVFLNFGISEFETKKYQDLILNYK